MTRIKFTFIGTVAATLLGLILGICGTLLAQNISIAVQLAVSVDVPKQTAPVVGLSLLGIGILMLFYVAYRGMQRPRGEGR